MLLVQGREALEANLCHGLRQAGLVVDLACDRAEADVAARQYPYDVVLLDLTLPRLDGLALLRRWRRAGLKTHVMGVTGPDDAQDRVRCLDCGADDCLSGPVELAEVLARLRALVRRKYQVKSPVIRVCDLEVDTPARAAKRGGQPLTLTPREYSLLEFLAFHRGKVASRTMIWEHLYGGRGGSNVVDVYIRYLRNKVDRGFDKPLILTRWGEGYMLRGED
jgi:DNA-binding response OmpR family regulator